MHHRLLGKGGTEFQVSQKRGTDTRHCAGDHWAEINERSMSSTDSFPRGVCSWWYCSEPLALWSMVLNCGRASESPVNFSKNAVYLDCTLHLLNHLGVGLTHVFFFFFSSQSSYGYSDALPGLKTTTSEWICILGPCQPDGLLVGLSEVGPQVRALDTETRTQAREVS